MEANLYYQGLHSKPVLVARTGMNEWEPPTGPEAFLVPKTIHTAGQHKIQSLWEEVIAPGIHAIMEADGVNWTSTDVLRIGYTTEAVAPLIIWIGVIPNTLSREDGHTIALRCKNVLITHKIDDVEVEIRESIVTHYAGPALEAPAPIYDPIAELLEPLTSTLGLSICCEKTPNTNGTGGFYVMDADSKIYLITARHVLFDSDEHDDNKLYNSKFTSQPCINVLLFSPSRFKEYLRKIEKEIINQRAMISIGERWLNAAGDDQARRDHAEAVIDRANDKIEAYQEHYDYVMQYWSKDTDRILGFLRFSPPIVLDEKRFTQDYALVEMASDKIDPDSFTANAIDLGIAITPARFTEQLYQNPRNGNHFDYPTDRIFKIQGIIPRKDMSTPPMFDKDNVPCLLVMKRGMATGLTLGRANEINSFTRKYFANSPPEKTLEWVICPYDSQSPPFAAKGDSGAAIVDSQGRLGGIVTGGSHHSDLVYATPAFAILESLKGHGFKVTTEVPGTA